MPPTPPHYPCSRAWGLLRATRSLHWKHSKKAFKAEAKKKAVEVAAKRKQEKRLMTKSYDKLSAAQLMALAATKAKED